MPSSRSRVNCSNNSATTVGASLSEGSSSNKTSADGKHLLFAAREQAGRGVQPRSQPRKAIEDRLDLGRIEIAATRRAKPEIFGNAQLRKDLPSLGHENETRARDHMRGKRRHFPTGEPVASPDRADQSAERFHQGR